MEDDASSANQLVHTSNCRAILIPLAAEIKLAGLGRLNPVVAGHEPATWEPVSHFQTAGSLQNEDDSVFVSSRNDVKFDRNVDNYVEHGW